MAIFRRSLLSSLRSRDPLHSDSVERPQRSVLYACASVLIFVTNHIDTLGVLDLKMMSLQRIEQTNFEAAVPQILDAMRVVQDFFGVAVCLYEIQRGERVHPGRADDAARGKPSSRFQHR